jgi:hypothetical protein
MIIFILFMIFIFALQISGLIHQKEYRDLRILLIIWLIAGVYAFFIVTDRPLLSPFEIITDLVTKLINTLHYL